MALLLGHTFTLLVDIFAMGAATPLNALPLAGSFARKIVTGQGASVAALVVDLAHGTFHSWGRSTME